MKPLTALLLALACCGTASASDAEIARRLDALRSVTPTIADRGWVESLIDYQESESIPHPEHPNHELPAHDIQARARQLLTHWDRQHALQQIRQTRGQMSLKSLNEAQTSALPQWIQQASAAEIAEFRRQNSAKELPEPLLLALTQRDNREEDWAALLSTGRSRQVMTLLEQSAEQIPAQRYRQRLQFALENPHLRGQAATLRGRFARIDATTQEQLLRQLSLEALSPELIDSALAASLVGTEDLLAARLTSPADATLAAWGLWRLNTESARGHLRQYAASTTAVSHLAQEIRQWLD